MKRSMIVYALLLGTAAALMTQSAALIAQQSNASGQYQGVSNPPPDDTITTPAPQSQPPAQAKPAPGKPMNAAPSAAPAPGMVAVPDVVTGPDSTSDPDADTAPEAGNAPDAASAPSPASAPAPMPVYNTATAPNSTDGTDGGIVEVEPTTAQPQAQPGFAERMADDNSDGDIVHPALLPPGVVGAGSMIRARLLDRLSTSFTEDGEKFRARVASDVFRGNEVLIPTGSEIDGTVEHVSTGHFAGHGSMVLHPDTVILPDGARFHLYAELSGAPGTNTRVGDEGNISPGSRAKKNAIEYGGGVGVGVVAGAAMGGPAGALAGTIVGASVVTVHLLMDHPQATLEVGTVLDFTVTEPLSLVAANPPANE